MQLLQFWQILNHGNLKKFIYANEFHSEKPCKLLFVCVCVRAKENLMISKMPLSLMPYAKLHARHEMRDYISLTGYLSISLWSVIKSPWDEEVCTE